ATQKPVFSFSAADYTISEASNVVRVTVQKWGVGTGAVSVATSDGTALAYDFDSDSGDYFPLEARLNFLDGEMNKSFLVSFINDSVFTGDRTFWINLSDVSTNAQLAYPATAAITIIEDDPFGRRGSLTTNELPSVLATNFGGLQIFLDPTNAQWRITGEL